jgi:hypothetical protein
MHRVSNSASFIMSVLAFGDCTSKFEDQWLALAGISAVKHLAIVQISCVFHSTVVAFLRVGPFPLLLYDEQNAVVCLKHLWSSRTKQVTLLELARNQNTDTGNFRIAHVLALAFVRGGAFLSAASEAAGNAMAATDARAAAEAPLTIERRETGAALIVTKACTAALSKHAHIRMLVCMVDLVSGERVCEASCWRQSHHLRQPSRTNGRKPHFAHHCLHLVHTSFWLVHDILVHSSTQFSFCTSLL